MSDFRKTRATLTAVYRNGDVLKQDHIVPVRVAVIQIPKASDTFRELSLRLVVDTKDSEALLEGLCSGYVSIDISDMLSSVERDTNTKVRLMPTTIVESEAVAK